MHCATSRHTLILICALALPGTAMAFEISGNGKLHLDYANQDGDAVTHRDNTLIRRAGIGFKGSFSENWSFAAAYDFAGNGSYKDVKLSYSGWQAGTVSLGQFKVPFGMDTLTGSSSRPFMEGPMPNEAFAPSRRQGLAFARETNTHTFTTMVFGESINGDEGDGVAARLTLSPRNSAGSVLHLGVAASTESAGKTVRLRSRPEIRPPKVRLVDTGSLADVSRTNQVGLEAAWQHGPLTTQAEWIHANVRRDAGLPGLSFHGGYVSGSWMLTGESRPYKGGRFPAAKPQRSSGAWELAVRYSTINLDDADVLGGDEKNITVGLNWYAPRNVRLMANYIIADSNRRGVTDDRRIFALRAQLSF